MVKPGAAVYKKLIPFLAVLILISGCAYTAVTPEEPKPKPGPQIKTGLTAVMPQAADVRKWPKVQPDEPINHVHIFAKEITDDLRGGLLKGGLFSALPAPGSPGAENAKGRELVITVNRFDMTEQGFNAWVVPHLLVNGAVLPVFTATSFLSAGQVDMGGYIFPSTKMGVTLNCMVQLMEPGIKKPVLKSSYLAEIPVEAVSQRELSAQESAAGPKGLAVANKTGKVALSAMAMMIGTDQNWAYVDEYSDLARAEQVASDQDAAGSARLEAALKAVKNLKPLAYTASEAKTLRNGNLTPANRASVVNKNRAAIKGLESPSRLPESDTITPERAAALFNDPKVEQAQVQAALAARTFALCTRLMTPPATPEEPDKPAAGEEPAKPETKAKPQKPAPQPLLNKQEVKALQSALAGKLKNRPNLQAALLSQADVTSGEAWPPMKRLLSEIGSSQTKAYLASR